MIGADRRGMMTAFEAIQTGTASPDMSAEEITALGYLIYSQMRVGGFAHIEPAYEFVRGFFNGFIEASMREEKFHVNNNSE